MAILKLPVVIDGVKSIEELANRVLDEYEYHGRTIREWADLISEIPPHGDLIDRNALVRDNGIKEIPEYYEVVRDAPTIIPADESDMDSFIRIFEEDDEEDWMDSFIRILKD